MSGSVDYRNPEIISSLSRACPSTCCCMQALWRRGGSGDTRDPQQFQVPCSDTQAAGQASVPLHWGLRGAPRKKWGHGLTVRGGGRGQASEESRICSLHEASWRIKVTLGTQYVTRGKCAQGSDGGSVCTHT